MPFLNARISGSDLPDNVRELAERLTGLSVDILRKKREVTSVAIEQVAAEKWYVGGSSIASLGLRTFYLEIYVTEGTNTKDEKAAYLKAVYAAAQSLLGSLHPTSYIVIKDVGADSWGYAGVSQEFRYIHGKSL